MPDSSALAVFLLATFLLNITPGPDMLYVIARSVGQGRTAGVVSALGIGAGTLVHTVAVALGISTLLVSLPLGFEVVKYAGAAYLFYLGVRTLFFSKDEAAAGDEPNLRRDSLSRIFSQGVLTNVLNPKVALFFIAFLPQFASASNGNLALQLVFLGLLFDTSGTLVNTAVALLSGTLGSGLMRRPGLVRVQRWFTGSVFVTLAARLALLERK
jgi:threonine/homoserine/homoserine lactone efflux protein